MIYSYCTYLNLKQNEFFFFKSSTSITHIHCKHISMLALVICMEYTVPQWSQPQGRDPLQYPVRKNMKECHLISCTHCTPFFAPVKIEALSCHKGLTHAGQSLANIQISPRNCNHLKELTIVVTIPHKKN